jgi:hypothetical protein
VTLLPELQSAISMLNFGLMYPKAFVGQYFEYAMLFAIFKMISGISCFFINTSVML